MLNKLNLDTVISIHSPCEGRDINTVGCRSSNFNFNPLSLRGERHKFVYNEKGEYQFQSTLPARGETHGF